MSQTPQQWLDDNRDQLGFCEKLNTRITKEACALYKKAALATTETWGTKRPRKTVKQYKDIRDYDTYIPCRDCEGVKIDKTEETALCLQDRKQKQPTPQINSRNIIRILAPDVLIPSTGGLIKRRISFTISDKIIAQIKLVQDKNRMAGHKVTITDIVRFMVMEACEIVIAEWRARGQVSDEEMDAVGLKR